MSTFKPEEVAALAESGNSVRATGGTAACCPSCCCADSCMARTAVAQGTQPAASQQRCCQSACTTLGHLGLTYFAPPLLQRFAAYYLHKWTTAALPKPVDRDVHRIHTWIGAVYQVRR